MLTKDEAFQLYNKLLVQRHDHDNYMQKCLELFIEPLPEKSKEENNLRTAMKILVDVLIMCSEGFELSRCQRSLDTAHDLIWKDK